MFRSKKNAFWSRIQARTTSHTSFSHNYEQHLKICNQHFTSFKHLLHTLQKTLQPYCNKCCCYQRPKHRYNGISIHQSMFRTKKHPPPKPRRLTIPFVKQDSSSSVTTQLTFNLTTPVENMSNQLTPPLTANSYISRNGSPPNFFLATQKSTISEMVEKDETRSRFEFKLAKAKTESSLRESEEDRYL